MPIDNADAPMRVRIFLNNVSMEAGAKKIWEKSLPALLPINLQSRP